MTSEYMPELHLSLYIQCSLLRLNTASSLNKEGLADTANTTNERKYFQRQLIDPWY